MKNTYILEGKNITDLKSLFEEFARAVNAPNGYFGLNLQSFDDCLFGGFGLEAPCEIIWKDSESSKHFLDCDVLRKYYEDILKNGNFISDEQKEYVIETIESAKKYEKSMFDEVVSFIQSVTERAAFNDKWIIDLVLK